MAAIGLRQGMPDVQPVRGTRQHLHIQYVGRHQLRVSGNIRIAGHQRQLGLQPHVRIGLHTDGGQPLAVQRLAISIHIRRHGEQLVMCRGRHIRCLGLCGSFLCLQAVNGFIRHVQLEVLCREGGSRRIHAETYFKLAAVHRGHIIHQPHDALRYGVFEGIHFVLPVVIVAGGQQGQGAQQAPI